MSLLGPVFYGQLKKSLYKGALNSQVLSQRQYYLTWRYSAPVCLSILVASTEAFESNMAVDGLVFILLKKVKDMISWSRAN